MQRDEQPIDLPRHEGVRHPIHASVALRMTGARAAFVAAVLAFSDDPGPANLERYLEASRALDDSRRSRQTPPQVGARVDAPAPARRVRDQAA